MPDFKQLLEQLKNALSKLDKKQKLIFGGVLAAGVIVLLLAVSSSSSPTLTYLFKKPLSKSDYARITKKLQEYGVDFRTKDDQFVLVNDEKSGAQIRMRLGQDGQLPTDIKGWELFDTEKWTTTDFERDVMKRRAIVGAMTKHIKMIKDIEDVRITVSMPKSSFYTQSDEPWKASVTITKTPYSDIYTNKKKIKGLINLIAHGIDRLKKENIVITDHNGNIISDFSDDGQTDYLTKSKLEFRLKEQIRIKLENSIRQKLETPLGSDRFKLRVECELNFDQMSVDKNEIIPIVITPDDPNTPYSELKVVLRAPTSTKSNTEIFKGPTYIPEGPAGTENNLPPGLKEKVNRFSHYQRNEVINNNVYSRKKTQIKKSPVEIKRISVAAIVDGVWNKVYKDGDLVITPEGSIKRQYSEVEDKTLKNLEEIIKNAIGFSAARGDSVVVKHLQFDRRKQFELEDEEIRKRERIRKTLIAAVAALSVLFLGTLMYRAIAKEIARRKRIREEELALQQQRMREQALRAAEEEGVEVELSLEEKARMEMQENAINMARERPEEVAQLLRTWLMEE